MLKAMFFDYRDVHIVEGFERRLEQARKVEGPLFVADELWEHGNMQLYGSVIRDPDGGYKCWYSTIEPRWWINMAYAQSDDGLHWRKPALDLHRFKRRKTNLVMTNNVHGPAIIRDESERNPGRRYKLVAGVAPHDCIQAFSSPDGIRWSALRSHPLLPTPPDCPMGFERLADGRYVIYHRLWGQGRRVFRSETTDLQTAFGEPKMVFEPGPVDPPNLQFYGMGSSSYGPYELGTLWAYHIDPEPLHNHTMHGHQQTELAFTRSGYAWHRVAPGEAFIPRGGKGEWDCGNLQCASQPVYLEDEIRFYYMGVNVGHASHWELKPQRAGLGMASIKPDRFVALEAGAKTGRLLTWPRRLGTDELLVNARVSRGGSVRLALVEADGKPIKGFEARRCVPIAGDSLAHEVRWSPSAPATRHASASFPLDRSIRVELHAERARVYSLSNPDAGETWSYRQFRSWR